MSTQAFSLSVHHGPFLLIVIMGPAMVCDLMGMTDLAARICNIQGYERALFDATTSRVEMTPGDREALSLHSAEVLGHLKKLAIVVDDPQRLDAEHVARRVGLRLRMFADLDEAMTWMSQP
jgi:hypothetical protein